MTDSDRKGECVIVSEQEYIPVLEGLLFAMGKSVAIRQLAAALELDEEEVRRLLLLMKESYQKDSLRGLQLLILEDRAQLCTKPEYYPYLIQLAAQPKKPVLTEAVLETLAIVAYKQPVTKVEIDRIRGVKSDHAVNRLVEYELIEEVGRLDAPGRPILFATTEEFLKNFGISSIAELPVAKPELVEQFKVEAEEEVSVTV